MIRALVLLAALAVIAGGTFSAAAVASGDEAVTGIHLSPADTPNGNEFAEIVGGELQIELTNLNDDATTTLGGVFNVTSTDQEALVWIESESAGVSFFRSDTGGAIGSRSNAVRLSPGESVLVGLEVDTSRASQGQVDYTVHAELPQQGQGASGAPSGEHSRETLTEAPPPTDSPPETGDGQPGTPGQVTETPTDARTPTPTTDEPDQEVGGLPLAPLVGLLALLAILTGIVFAYRRLLGGPAVRIEVAGDGLAVTDGALDPAIYEAAEGAVTLKLGEIDAWSEETGEPVRLGDAIRLANTTDAPLGVTATADSGAPEGLELLAGDWGTDLLGSDLTLDPDEDVGISVRLPGDADLRRTATVRVSGDPA